MKTRYESAAQQSQLRSFKIKTTTTTTKQTPNTTLEAARHDSVNITSLSTVLFIRKKLKKLKKRNDMQYMKLTNEDSVMKYS